MERGCVQQPNFLGKVRQLLQLGKLLRNFIKWVRMDCLLGKLPWTACFFSRAYRFFVFGYSSTAIANNNTRIAADCTGSKPGTKRAICVLLKIWFVVVLKNQLICKLFAFEQSTCWGQKHHTSNTLAVPVYSKKHKKAVENSIKTPCNGFGD